MHVLSIATDSTLPESGKLILPGSVFETVLGPSTNAVILSSGASQQFPQDAFLKEINVSACAGYPSPRTKFPASWPCCLKMRPAGFRRQSCSARCTRKRASRMWMKRCGMLTLRRLQAMNLSETSHIREPKMMVLSFGLRSAARRHSPMMAPSSAITASAATSRK